MAKIPKLPVFGQPIFIISENPLEERVTVVGERGLLNTLVYFAVDAVMVEKIGYLDKKMNKIIINEGMHAEGDETKSLEVVMDYEKNFSKDPDCATIFVDEVEAQLVARKFNENQKKQCKKLLDLATKAYNEYDTIISLCTVK